MRYAKLSDLKDICRIKNLHSKWLGHLREDKIEQRIKDGQVIFQDGVVIIYSIAQKFRKIGRNTAINIPKGATILHNLFKDKKARARELMEEFIKTQKEDIYLSVRKDNVLAINGYVKLGFERIGYQWWKDGELEGAVYVLRKSGSLRKYLR